MNPSHCGITIGNDSEASLSRNIITGSRYHGIRCTGGKILADSNLVIVNNVILRSSYAGLAIADTARTDIENNIIAENERGVVGFSSDKGKEPSVRLRGENIAYENATQTEGIKMPSELIGLDPQFEDPDSGLFSTTADDAKNMGLTNPADLQALWKKWGEATNR